MVARIFAEPTSHGLGSSSGASPWCSARNCSAFSRLSRSWDQHHAADGLAALEERVRLGRFGQRERAVDEHLQPAGGDVVDEVRPIIFCARSVAISAPRNTPVSDWLFMPSTDTSNGCGSRPALPTVIARPRYARHATLPCRILPPTESTTRSTPRPSVIARTFVDPVGVRVVDAVVEAERLQPLEPVVARRGGDHRRAGALGELDRGDADATRAGLDRAPSRRPDEVAELEEAVVGGAERDRHARDGDEVGAVGDRPRDDRGRDDELGVRAPEHRCATTRWPT